MTGQDVHSAKFADFRSALGYGSGRASGFKIKSQPPLATDKISNIFYPNEPIHPAPAISGMYQYYYYNALAKLFHCNLVSKAGDDASIRGYNRNLLYYCQPQKLRKIDGCDFIFQEIKRSSMKRMTPNYCQFVQRLINRRASTSVVHGQILEMETYTLPLRGTFEDVPGMITARAEGRSRAALDPHRASGSGTSSCHHLWSSRKKGLATFFWNMCEMRRSTYDVAHKSMEMSQEIRRRQNDFLAARGSVVPPIGLKLDPVPYVNYVMPPLDEDMFNGFEDFAPPYVPKDVDEDEGAHEDEDGGCHFSSPRTPSEDY
jgi:hypothetical protein